MLELYNAYVSTCSQKVRMASAEKALPWTNRQIIFANNDHLSDWHLTLHPNGVVPTLSDLDDEVISPVVEPATLVVACVLHSQSTSCRTGSAPP